MSPFVDERLSILDGMTASYRLLVGLKFKSQGAVAG